MYSYSRPCVAWDASTVSVSVSVQRNIEASLASQ
jgi:hypothetical protein